MRKVDYDKIAPAYDERYRRNDFSGVRATLEAFVGSDSPARVVEVGCGSGQWLNLLESRAGCVIGLDPSRAMLERAQTNAARALLLRAYAESLPVQSSSVDRVFCINALHHFADAAMFVREARRTLRSGGGLLSVGLDPHSGLDQWWVYDFFPDASSADRKRYPPSAKLRELFRAAGLVDVTTEVAQHIPAALPFEAALEQGFLDRRATSQFQVIDDAHWEAGLARIRAEQPILRADLRLYATVGFLPGRAAV